jgi:serine/threonine-protein kinase
VNVRGFLGAGCAWALFALVLGAGSGLARDYDDRDASDREYATQEYYGAIAYSPSTRAYGWAYDYASRGGAKERALAQCQRHADANDCVVPVWFRNACGALAIGADGYGTGWGVSRKLAESYAIQSCGRYSDGCSVVRWVCTTK